MNEKKQFIRGRPGMNSRAQIVKPAESGFGNRNALPARFSFLGRNSFAARSNAFNARPRNEFQGSNRETRWKRVQPDERADENYYPHRFKPLMG